MEAVNGKQKKGLNVLFKPLFLVIQRGQLNLVSK